MKEDQPKEAAQQELIEKQYKIFKLTTDGTEEIDFVKWASDLNRNHPIALEYQSQRKKYFDQLRKERAALIKKELKQQESNLSQTIDSMQIRRNLQIDRQSSRDSPKSFGSGFRDVKTPIQKSKHELSRNLTSLSKRFALRLESTIDQTSNNLTQTIDRNTSLYNQSQYQLGDQPNTLKRKVASSLTPFKSKNVITKKYDISKSRLLSQVRKHLNLVTRANTFENNYLHQEDAKRFSTKNPINVYYQIAQHNDYNFKSNEILKPSYKEDIKNLRQNYIERCNEEQKAALFEKTDYEVQPQTRTSYSGKRKSIIIDAQKRSQSVTPSNKQQALPQTSKNFNNDEPDVPLTSYNYSKFYNEGSIIFKATISANKIKQLSETMDLKMRQSRLKQYQFKQSLILNNLKTRGTAEQEIQNQYKLLSEQQVLL